MQQLSSDISYSSDQDAFSIFGMIFTLVDFRHINISPALALSFICHCVALASNKSLISVDSIKYYSGKHVNSN